MSRVRCRIAVASARLLTTTTRALLLRLRTTQKPVKTPFPAPSPASASSLNPLKRFCHLLLTQIGHSAGAGSCNTLLYSQFFLKRTWLGFDFIRMASTLVKPPAHDSTVLEEKAKGNGLLSKTLKVVFVLGGPGSGKGTQCALIVDRFGFTHLSAGDLLRAEISSGSENGVMIQNMIKEGKIVPSEVTVKLLQNAMIKSGNDKFLIDGFPRNDENRAAFELVTGIKPEFILFFDCAEEEMERRILGRNQGRVDDNIETIRKRFKVFVESSLPVINHYDSFGKVRKIDAGRAREEVFESVKPLFATFLTQEQET